MDNNKYDIIRLRMEKTAEALRKNNITAQCVDSVAEIPDVLNEWLCKGQTVAVGGSMSLYESGVIDMLRNGDYVFLDRYQKNLDKLQIAEIYRKSFYADAYLCSANAITENGEIYCLDGAGNRVAAIAYGPQSVIMVVGYNKIVCDMKQARKRVKEISAPANCKRLGLQTPCAVNGSCADCRSNNRICSIGLELSYQRVANRIKVILVGEELGY